MLENPCLFVDSNHNRIQKQSSSFAVAELLFLCREIELRRTSIYDDEIKSLRVLIDSYIMSGDSLAVVNDMKSRLEIKYEEALKGVHKNKLFQCADGRWKTKNPQIAKKTRIDLLAALYDHYFGVNLKSLTISRIFYEWVEEVKHDAELGHRSILTYDRYKSDWRRFYEGSELASMNIALVKASHIKNHYKEICAHGAITRKCLNNVKAIMNHIYDYAFDKDYVGNNIARNVSTRDLYCKEVDNELKVYTNKERDLILAQAEKEDDVYARAIILMFCSCTRIGEIEALKWEDVDFNAKTMYIHREQVRRKDENGHEIFVCVNHTKSGLKEGNRYQPLSEKAIEVLKAQRRTNPFGETVFMYDDRPLITNTINKHLRRICEKVGVEYMSSHKIRFWSVTNMYANGMQQADIQRMAGHADPATTNHYKRVSRLGDIDTDSWNEMFG